MVQACYLLVQMTVYSESSNLGHIFQDIGTADLSTFQFVSVVLDFVLSHHYD